MPTFGQMVKERRIELGMTVTGLAKKIGVSPNFVSIVERGDTLVHDGIVQDFAGGLEVDGEAFVEALANDRRFAELTTSESVPLLQKMMAAYLEQAGAELSAADTILEINDALKEYVAGMAWPEASTPDEIAERERSRQVQVASILLLSLWLSELEGQDGYRLAVDQLRYRSERLP